MKGFLPIFMALLSTQAFSYQPEPAPAGTRLNLSLGQLFIPESYKPPEGRVTLLIHLHGSAQVMEGNLVRSGWKAVLVTISLKGLSGVYTEQFSKPEVFRALLDEVREKLKQQGIAKDPKIEKLYITSFSAGFGGVRELLKHEEFYQRIAGLMMVDSIHAGFAGDPAQRQVDPALMKDFLRFARDAAEGKKVMVISHSQIKPETYASTTETADYLLAQLGVKREQVQENWAEGWQLTSRYTDKGLQIYGFAGETGADHMKHLHNLWMLMQRVEMGN